MIVVCPNCFTRFNLPDEQAKTGVKLRCSVCKHVFPLPEAETQTVLPDLDPLAGSSAMSEASPSFVRRHVGLLLLLVVLLAGVGFLYFSPPAVFDPFQRRAQTAEELLGKISLTDVRMYPVSNRQSGTLIVIDGKVVNNFNTPRELIRLEAALYDKAGSRLTAKEQLAGNAISLLQLQLLPEQELEAALNSKIGVLTNNTNVVSGGEVPFMMVFYNPPEEAAEFSVKVLEARMPPADR